MLVAMFCWDTGLKEIQTKRLLDILVFPSGSISWASNHSDLRLVSWQPRNYDFSRSVPDPVLNGSADPDPDPSRSKLSAKKRKKWKLSLAEDMTFMTFFDQKF
jgi:hypothetical protein